MRRCLALATTLLLLAAPAAADVPDLSDSRIEIENPFPFTAAPCGADAMPVIDVYVISHGFPVELIASDVWIHGGDHAFCTTMIADSSTFYPDPGHTTFSGAPRLGLEAAAGCDPVGLLVIAAGWVIDAAEFRIASPDLNADGHVTVTDFGLFAARYYGTDACADFTRDGAVSVADFGEFAGWYNACDCE